ncbi:MAG: hypothetical protein PGN13_06370 [Patulibacter minatonensis]
MRHLSSRRLAWIGGLAAAACAVPSSAGASGFGPPTTVSGRDDAEAPLVAIAPNGRTAVMWRREVRTGKRWVGQLRVALGPSPDRLGQPTTVAAGWRAVASSDARPQLLARPDGGFVACLPDTSRTKTTVIGCSVAPPAGGFGGLLVVRRGKGDGTTIAPAVRPDSSVALLLERVDRDRRGTPTGLTRTLRTITRDGALQPERAIAPAGESVAFGASGSLVSLADGTLAFRVGMADPASPATATTNAAFWPGVRVMPAGAGEFGPATRIGTAHVNGRFELGGTTRLWAAFATGGEPDAPTEDRVAPRGADGTFGPESTLPLATDDTFRHTIDHAIVDVPGDGLLALSSEASTSYDDSDCFNPVSGQISAGAPGGIAARLSGRGQIALAGDAVSLADGTAIASWENGASYRGGRPHGGRDPAGRGCELRQGTPPADARLAVQLDARRGRQPRGPRLVDRRGRPALERGGQRPAHRGAVREVRPAPAPPRDALRRVAGAWSSAAALSPRRRPGPRCPGARAGGP